MSILVGLSMFIICPRLHETNEPSTCCHGRVVDVDGLTGDFWVWLSVFVGCSDSKVQLSGTAGMSEWRTQPDKPSLLYSLSDFSMSINLCLTYSPVPIDGIDTFIYIICLMAVFLTQPSYHLVKCLSPLSYK